MEPTLEQRLSHEQHHRWLHEMHRRGDYEGLLKAALLFNTLYYQERIKVRWAIDQAAANLGSQLQSDHRYTDPSPGNS
jgi:hypothetical protein